MIKKNELEAVLEGMCHALGLSHWCPKCEKLRKPVVARGGEGHKCPRCGTPTEERECEKPRP